MSDEPATTEVTLRIQMLERLLTDDSFLDTEIKKEIKKYDDDGNLKIDRAEFQKMLNCYLVTLSEEGSSEKFDDIDKEWKIQEALPAHLRREVARRGMVVWRWLLDVGGGL